MNLGCGPDSWGDVRVDIDYMTQTGVKSRLNVRADAENLPFRDSAFSECRCWHMIEHSIHPMRVLAEIRRTSNSASIRFPIDEGYYKQMVIGLIGLDWNMFITAYRTLRKRAHRWIITSPQARKTDRFVEFPRWLVVLKYGRKAKALSQLFKPLKYYYELEVRF